MAIPLTNTQFVEVKLFSTNTTQVAINRLNYLVTAQTGTGSTLEAMLSQLAASITADYKAFMSSSARYLGMTGQIVANGSSILIPNADGAGDGERGEALLPPQTAGLITVRTAQPGRIGRGRIYLPWQGTADQGDDGKPTNAQLARFELWAAQMTLPVVVGAGGNTVTVRYGVSDAGHARFFPMNDFTVRRAWATQRRRSFINRADRLPF